MVAGAGAMADAALAMRQVRRQMEYYMRAREARRERFRDRRFSAGEAPSAHTDFDCFHFCEECGYLAGKGGACPSCGIEGLLNLSHHPTADRLRDHEAAVRLTSPKWVQALWGGTVLSVTGGALWGLDFAAAGILGGAVLAPALYFGALRGMTWMLLRIRPSRPHRWRLPLPMVGLDGRAKETITGPVRGGGALLTAPFSGKPCLAYQVCILFDTPNDARPPEWVLHEAVGSDVTVGETMIAGDRLFLSAVLEPMRHEDVPDLDLERFLRQRGLFSTDGDFELYEARLEEGMPVRGEVTDGNAPVVITAEDLKPSARAW